MKKNKVYFQRDFPDDESCLEWLINQQHPNGIKCPICNKVTKHHKLTKSRCYACDNCGNRVYPTAKTIFHKSTTPLKTWFEVIKRISNSKNNITAKAIQREYGMTYKTAWRMVHKIREYFKGNVELSSTSDLSGNVNGNNVSLKNRHKNIKKKAAFNYNGSVPGQLVKRTLEQKENQKDFHWKRDRTARLLRLQILLWQNPQGLEIEELSQKCRASKRTIYRDLQAIESELNIPIWEQGKKRGIVEGYYLPPISFNLEEAFNIFLASRLLQRLTHSYNPYLASTFMKISSIIPPFLRKKIQDSMDFAEQRPIKEYEIRNLKTIIQAWLTQHRVKIRYQDELYSELMEIIIEPYFLEPIPNFHSIIVIAYCPSMRCVNSYNIDRIVGDVALCADTFEIPSDFNPVNVINSAWGMPTGDEIITAKLHFKPTVSKIIMSTIWHPSQMIELQGDGSLIATFKIRKLSGFRSWVLSWGDEVEILEPISFRKEMTDFAKTILQLYSK